ncbi:MAG TPA: HGGxSTG domain-containing protein, partial [Nannocystaceae bacterium]|nr:HGGxSTG domain-containing protein [Nannocystaceae bacterium]
MHPTDSLAPVPADRPRCGAKKRDGTPCPSYPVVGAKRCRMHGARAGAPIKHGRYSKHLGRIREAYEAAIQDKGLLDLREPIAAIDAIVRRLAERVEELDTPDYRRRLLDLLKESRGADAGKAAAARFTLEELIERGADEDQTLGVLRDSLSELAKRIVQGT